MSSHFLVGLDSLLEVSPLHAQVVFSLAHSPEVLAMPVVLAALWLNLALMERQVMEERCPGGRCLFPPGGATHRTRHHGKRLSFQNVSHRACTGSVHNSLAVDTRMISVRVLLDALSGSIPRHGSQMRRRCDS
jgi:hypothetical protein